MSKAYTPISCVVRRMTTRAVLVLTEDSEEKWIPFSVIDEEDLADIQIGPDQVELNVANWFYERELM